MPTPLVDSFTLTLFTIPLVSGRFQNTLAPTVGILRVEDGINRQIASLHGTMSALGGIVRVLIVVRLMRDFGRRRLKAWGSVSCGIGIAVPTLRDGLRWSLSGGLITAVIINRKLLRHL